jgi:hypothetical protein
MDCNRRAVGAGADGFLTQGRGVHQLPTSSRPSDPRQRRWRQTNDASLATEPADASTRALLARINVRWGHSRASTGHLAGRAIAPAAPTSAAGVRKSRAVWCIRMGCADAPRPPVSRTCSDATAPTRTTTSPRSSPRSASGSPARWSRVERTRRGSAPCISAAVSGHRSRPGSANDSNARVSGRPDGHRGTGGGQAARASISTRGLGRSQRPPTANAAMVNTVMTAENT